MATRVTSQRTLSSLLRIVTIAHIGRYYEEIMTTRIAAIAIIAMLIAGVAAFAADNNAAAAFGVGKTRNVVFSNDMKIGDKVLAAGEYKVLHLMEGEEHTLVFKSLNNQEKARVKCSMQKLEKKADESLTEYKNIGNERILTALVFRGDTYKHTF